MNLEQLRHVLQVLVAAVKGLRLYPLDHPATARQIQVLLDALLPLLRHKKSIKLGILEGTLFVEDHLFTQDFPAADDLAGLLEGVGLVGLEFQSGLAAGDVRVLLDQLHTGERKGRAFVAALQERNVIGIRAVSGDEDDEEAGQPHKVYRRALKVVDQIFTDVRMGEIPSSEDAIKVVKSMAQLTITEPHALFALTMLKDYDNYTFTHSVNVSVLSLAVGRACGVSEDQLRTLGLGGLLHDLGKLKIDLGIINKPGRLTEAEFETIKQHPRFGTEIIARMEGVTEEVMDIVLGHHLRYDRSGYPTDALGRSMSPLVDMASIADAYDAMTTMRAYQPPLTPCKAIAGLRDLSGTSLHPTFVEQFVASLGPYPVGSLVRLDSNEIGLVVKVDPAEPSLADIKVLFDTAGQLLDDPFVIHLGPAQPRRIVAEVDMYRKKVEVTDFLD